MPDFDEALRALRREIDVIDEQLQDLMIRRTRVVERVRDLKKDLKVKIRAAREAEIAYRLVDRHKGVFPKRDLLRIWREMIMATLAIEGPFSVAVFAGKNADAFWDLARDHFCLSLPMTRHQSVKQVVNAVMCGEAAVGVLPVPSIDDPLPWWPLLAAAGDTLPRVICRLPFAGRGNARGDQAEAFVVCPADQEPTGRDRSLFAFEVADAIPQGSIQTALMTAGLPPTMVQPWKDAAVDAFLYLVEIDDFVPAADPRVSTFLAALKRAVTRVVPLGGYARPLTAEELAPAPDSE